MNKIKKIVFLILSIIILIMFVSCSQKNMLDTSVKESPSENTISLKNKKTLKISYLLGYGDVTSAIKLYKKSYPDVSIIENSVNTNDMMAFDNYKIQLATDLMSGIGPDIILDPSCSSTSSTFKSIHKVAASGIFYDLNKLISKDKEFDKSDYLESIIDCGVFDNKRYFFPLTYAIDEFITKKDILEEHKVKIDTSDWTLKSLSQIAKKFREDNGKSAYLFSFNLYFANIIQNTGISFVDYKEKKTSFNSKEFIELLNIYKDINPSINRTVSTNSFDYQFTKGECVLLKSYMGSSPISVWSDCSSIINEAELYPFPTYKDENTVYVKPMNIVAINSKCKYPDEAYKFIKLLLSNDLRNEVGDKNLVLNESRVNKEAYKEDIKFWGTPDRFSNGKKSLSENQVKYLENRILKTKCSVLYDSEILSMIEKEASLFINGNKTAEEIAKSLDYKVTLYLNE